MLRYLIATLVLAALPGSASASGFEKFVTDLVAAPAEAAKRFDGCTVLVTPSGEVRHPCKLTAADLVGGTTGVTLQALRVKDRLFPRSMLEYIEADVEARKGGKLVATFHVIEVGGQGNPDGPNGGWQVSAQAWSKLMSDKDAAAAAKAGKLVEPKIADVTAPADKGMKDQEVSDRTQGIETIRQWLTGREDLKEVLARAISSDAVAFGSAAGQRYAGKAGAKAIRAWKSKLVQSGGLDVSGGSMVIYVVTEAYLSVPARTPYVMFAVFIQRMTPGGGSLATEPALFQFSLVQP